MELHEKELGVIDTSSYKIRATQTMYADGTLAVIGECYEPDLKYWEPWGTFSVNLTGYGMIPPQNCIFINHDIFGTEAFNKFYEELCDTSFGQKPVKFGYAQSVMVKLK